MYRPPATLQAGLALFDDEKGRNWIVGRSKIMYDPDKECKEMIIAIKSYCKEKKIAPNALAKKAGLSSSTVGYILSGKTKPQVHTVILICNALDISIRQLFDDGEQIESKDLNQVNSFDEDRLLKRYRKLPAKKKKMLGIYVDMLLQYEEE